MMLRNILLIPIRIMRDIVEFFIIYLPGGLGKRLRRFYYKRRCKEWGNNIHIDTGVIIIGANHISIGDNVHIDKYCVISAGRVTTGKITKRPIEPYAVEEGELVIGSNIHIAQFCVLMAYGGITIGDKCALSAGTKMYSLTNVPNDFDQPNKIVSIMPLQSSETPYLMSPVVLEENVWVGLNSVVLPGTVIKKNSFAAINSVIAGRFEENSYLSGQPARKCRDRFVRDVGRSDGNGIAYDISEGSRDD